MEVAITASKTYGGVTLAEMEDGAMYLDSSDTIRIKRGEYIVSFNGSGMIAVESAKSYAENGIRCGDRMASGDSVKFVQE